MNNYDEILNFYREYVKLEQVVRKGWLMCNVPAKRLESVADHTLQLIMLASVITKKLNINVNMTKLIDMLLIHDLGEIIIGDISEIEGDRANKKKDESKSVKKILDKLDVNNSKYYYDLWLEMETRDTDISKFAYLLDKIDAVIKSGIYEEDFSIIGLFDEFSSLQINKKTFNDSILEDFFLYICSKYKNKE